MTAKTEATPFVQELLHRPTDELGLEAGDNDLACSQHSVVGISG